MEMSPETIRALLDAFERSDWREMVVEVGDDRLHVSRDKLTELAPAGAAPVRDGGAQPAGPVAAGDPPLPPVAKASSATVPPTVPPAVPAGNSPRVKASPLARRVAEERGVDLDGLKGSGPGGRIVKADVESAGAPGAAPEMAAPAETAGTETAKGTTTYQDLTRLQQVVSRRMAESKATAPHFYLQAEIDMSAAVEARARLKGLTPEGEVVPSFNDMIVKACALALREFPLANGAYKDGRFELYSRVNVGVAVAAQDALVVPTVFDADRKGLRVIATDARTLAGKVRDGSITPPELSGGTFTVSNLGMYGVASFAAIINPPQAAILSVGAVEQRAVVRDEQLLARHTMTLTLVCDHRILYGADAAQFLARIRELLQAPASLTL